MGGTRGLDQAPHLAYSAPSAVTARGALTG